MKRDGWALPQQLQRTGKLPEWAAEKPRLTPAGEWWMKAYRHLTTCRSQPRAGVGMIPWTAIKAYADAYGLSHATMRLLVEVIEELDSSFRDWMLAHDGTADQKVTKPAGGSQGARLPHRRRR